MKRHFLPAIAIIFFCGSLPVLSQNPQLMLPDGNGAWIVEVATSGGIFGVGVGDFVITSEGKISCRVDMNCPIGFGTSDFSPLMESIRADMLHAPSPVVVGLCNDCIKSTIRIRRRDWSGMVRTFSASFDITTKGALPPEVVKIYDAVVALRK